MIKLIGFARSKNELPFTDELSNDVKEYIKVLYKDPVKHSAATMKKFVSKFSHPRNHPTETQILSQITQLTSKKKKDGLEAFAAQAVVAAANAQAVIVAVENEALMRAEAEANNAIINIE